MDAVELAAGDGQVPWAGGAAADDDCIEVGAERFTGNVYTGVHAGFKNDAFAFQQVQAPVHHRFFQLEIGNAVTQESAWPGVPLEHDHRVTGRVELLGAGQAGRTGADHRHRFARAPQGRLRVNPSPFEGVFDDGFFNLFDGHRRCVDGQDARLLAGCRAEAAGKLGKVIGGHELPEGRLPAPMVHLVVPVGNAVAQGAAGVAGGHPAIHAAGGLVAQGPLGEGPIDLLEIPDALFYRAPDGQLPVVFHESRGFSHGV